MPSLIEQASLRLAQLRQAGAAMPDSPLSPSAPSIPMAPLPPIPPLPSVGAATTAPVRSRLVSIDQARLAQVGIVTPQAPRSQVADQFRVIKRPLISNAVGKHAADVAHGNLIMVTSALPGEGKTFTAINLAMSLASELDLRVLLVDADVTRPSIMNVLGLPRGLGLLDLVQEEAADACDAILRTDIDKLTLLPSGTAHPRATELLASDAMARLLREMAGRYPDRIIVFDSPPLLLTTESRVLASHMGQVVVVVQAGQTLRSNVQTALATIETCPVRLMLLNQARNAAHSSYGYAYGYGYAPA